MYVKIKATKIKHGLGCKGDEELGDYITQESIYRVSTKLGCI